jgi:NAD(P)-dependent dehydrogenase (short-subunit alcohol dehydrogenase family)
MAKGATRAGCCHGRVALVTGAGRGIGRGHALELARQGARVVVNDMGVALDGAPAQSSEAEEVVAEILAAGGMAVTDTNDASDIEGAARMVERARTEFGGLDIVVNNAGVLRDAALVNMSPDDWDTVVRVHLRSTFAVTKSAATGWRAESKAGRPVDGRVINTTSGAGLYGNVGQVNYAAAKAGIVGFTLTAALELSRYGVTVNAVAPGGRTRMTEHVFAGMLGDAADFDAFDPANVAPLVTWLASPESADITGRVFEAWGGRIAVVDGWRVGPIKEVARRWEPDEVGPVLRELLADAAPVASLLESG